MQSLLFDARLAKRRLMFRDPSLAAVEKTPLRQTAPVLAVAQLYRHLRLEVYRRRRCLHAYDAADRRAIGTVSGRGQDAFRRGRRYRPRPSPRLGRPDGVLRSSFARRAWSGLLESAADERRWQQLRADHPGPFHDTYPCVLPDGDLAFVSTRCKGRYLCLQHVEIVTLFRSRPDGSDPRPLSYENLSEWGPTVMRDGRILWTRSEYQDKGAAHGHTLWAIRPDGMHVEQIFGNNTDLNLMNGYEMPGRHEICATLIPHFGDFQGPIAIIDLAKGPFDRKAAKIITPDEPISNGGNGGRFRDPVPISEDCLLVSHRLDRHWSLYVIDRQGNRELLYLDPEIGSMCPLPLRPRQRPPVLSSQVSDRPSDAPGQLVVADVYQGLGQAVPRGSVKYLRICQELRSNLDRLPDKGFAASHDKYRAGVVEQNGAVTGPYGWPTFIAKAVIGTVPVETDGSANFEAPSGATLYFQALDADYNEIQRMRSVMQLQPGEIRSCVGCHEQPADCRHVGVDGTVGAAPTRRPSRSRRPWAAGAFDYRKLIQPIFDAKCVRCHDAKHAKGLDLIGNLGPSQSSIVLPQTDRRRLGASLRPELECASHQGRTAHLRYHQEQVVFGT